MCAVAGAKTHVGRSSDEPGPFPCARLPLQPQGNTAATRASYHPFSPTEADRSTPADGPRSSPIGKAAVAQADPVQSGTAGLAAGRRVHSHLERDGWPRTAHAAALSGSG